MTATPDEMKRVVQAFEETHPPLLRALADLHLQGNATLESHDMAQGDFRDRFDAFLLECLRDYGVRTDDFANAVRDLENMRATISLLHALP